MTVQNVICVRLHNRGVFCKLLPENPNAIRVGEEDQSSLVISADGCNTIELLRDCGMLKCGAGAHCFAGGLQDQQIATKLKITPEKAARWRNRFLDGGVEARVSCAPGTVQLEPGPYRRRVLSCTRSGRIGLFQAGHRSIMLAIATKQRLKRRLRNRKAILSPDVEQQDKAATRCAGRGDT